jgi:hypothetical protein
MSAGSFSFRPEQDEGDELELARDPSAGRHNPAQPMLDRLLVTVKATARLASIDGGAVALLLLRSVALWGRAVLPAQAQGLVSFLLTSLQGHVERLPEPGFKPGPGAPGVVAVHAAFTEALRNDGLVDPAFEDGRPYALRPFRTADEPRIHVRKFMGLMTRCPKDEEARGLLLEGAVCEMLMRAPPLPKGVHEKVVGTVLAPAPPSAMRVHELQNLLTRSWP